MKRWLALFGVLIATVVYASPLPLGGTVGVVDATRYRTIQQAIDATPTGGLMIIPAGDYDSTTVPRVTQPLTVSRRISIVGLGCLREGNDDVTGGAGGATLRFQNPSLDAVIFNNVNNTRLVDGSNIENIYFRGAHADGAGRGLVIRAVHHMTIRDCMIDNFPNWAVVQDSSTNSDDAIVNVQFERCYFARNQRSQGLVSLGRGNNHTYSTATVFRDCHFIQNKGKALDLGACFGTTVDRCTFENDNEDTTGDLSSPGSGNAYIFSWNNHTGYTENLTIKDCWFERVVPLDTLNAPKSFSIYIKGHVNVPVIERCRFVRNFQNSLQAIKFEDTNEVTYGGAIRDNLGFLGYPTVGHEDVVMSSNSRVLFSNNWLHDIGAGRGASDKRWWITSPDVGHVIRNSDFRRIRIQSQSRDSIAALGNQADNGELVYDNNAGQLVTKSGNAWMRLAIVIGAGPGPPQSGTWSIGDMATNANRDTLFVRKNAGTGIAATDWRYVVLN